MTLNTLFFLMVLNQTVKVGCNIAILLFALSQQASPMVVGVLTAMSGVFPMLVAVSIGRLTDTYGPRVPMIAGSMVVIASAFLPFVWPGLPALFVTSAFLSLGAVAFSVSVQSTVGHFGGADDRPRNFSWLSMAISAGGVLGPLAAGVLIDQVGHRATFMVFASVPFVGLLTVLLGKLAFPAQAQGGAQRGESLAVGSPEAAAQQKAKKSRRAIDLFRIPSLRTIYLLTTMHVAAWEIVSFLVPVYGTSIGLSASSIGLILGAFASATFLVRIVLPIFAHRLPPLKLIRLSLILSGALGTLVPLATSVPVLMLIGFSLGMVLGITQPLAMSVLHEATPPERTGEAFGMRTAIVNLSGTTTPLIFGAMGSAFGMLPVFWATAGMIWLAVWALR